MKKGVIVVRKSWVCRWTGVRQAAERIGVSREALSRALSGREPRAVSAKKMARLTIIDESASK